MLHVIPRFSKIEDALNTLPKGMSGLKYVKKALGAELPLTHKPSESIKGCDVYRSYSQSEESTFNTAVAFLLLTSLLCRQAVFQRENFLLEDINDCPPIFRQHLQNMTRTNPKAKVSNLEAQILYGCPNQSDHIDSNLINASITTFNG